MKLKKTSAVNEKIRNLDGKIDFLEKNQDECLKTTKENLKYLINHDRNVRQQNILLFGFPGSDDISLGGNSFSSDKDAIINHLFMQMGIEEELKVTGMFRLGKKINTNDDNEERYRCRPIKIIFHPGDT